MIKLLPFILIAVLILGGLGYWRFVASKPSLTSSSSIAPQSPIEVPKTLPAASLEDRVISLEKLVTKVVTILNTLKSQSGSITNSSSIDSFSIDASITELKARVSALEKATPAPASSGTSSKATIYIPLGSGGTSELTDWSSLNTFQITLDPSQYPGYTSMQLEVNMRLNQPGGTLYSRLYNLSDSSAKSSEITTTSTSSNVVSSSTFNLSSGSKTYILQAKTSDGSIGFLDYARIKVNF